MLDSAVYIPVPDLPGYAVSRNLEVYGPRGPRKVQRGQLCIWRNGKPHMFSVRRLLAQALTEKSHAEMAQAQTPTAFPKRPQPDGPGVAATVTPLIDAALRARFQRAAELLRDIYSLHNSLQQTQDNIADSLARIAFAQDQS